MFNQTILLNEMLYGSHGVSVVGSGGAVVGGVADIVPHTAGTIIIGSGGTVIGGTGTVSYTFKQVNNADVVQNTKPSTVKITIQPTGYIEQYDITISDKTPISTISSLLGTFVLSATSNTKPSTTSGRIVLTYYLTAGLNTRISSSKLIIVSGHNLIATLNTKPSKIASATSLTYLLSLVCKQRLSRINAILFNGGLEKCLVLNTQTTALSEYTNFIPDSIIEHNRRYYAAFDDGIYLLEGDDDYGLTIETSLRTGQQDLNIMEQKSICDVFVSGSFDGQSTEISSYTDNGKIGTPYPLISYGDGVNKRAKLPKATKSRYWGFEINGANQIDVIEVPQVITSRRV